MTRSGFVACSRSLAAALCFAVGCSGDAEKRPNVLWIVWDTVRADHMSLYHYAKPTTPHVDAWAKGARVFDDCISPGTTTIPSHASMFTGLAAKQHCASNDHQNLDSNLDTIAELLQRTGYQTYVWAANPHISKESHYTQGFEVERHPWDPDELERARKIVAAKSGADAESEVNSRLDVRGSQAWVVKAAGELAHDTTLDWLTHQRDPSKPYFVFLNYMEAHRPLIPARAARERTMSAEQVAASYDIDFSWDATWNFNFGLKEYSADELALLSATYDAAIVELDDVFGRLITSLEQSGQLDNTIVILTADHGEHLGEHHLLDHQYSAYQELLRVPLVVKFPPRLAAGHETRPVMTHDLFSTLLELTHTPPPKGVEIQSLSLTTPREHRVRVSEYPSPFERAFKTVRDEHPDFDVSPWNRGLSAILDGASKLIEGTDEKRELYDLGADPGELHDLSNTDTDSSGKLSRGLDNYLGGLHCLGSGEQVESNANDRLLNGLGYSGDDDKPKAHDDKRKGSKPPQSPTDH